MATAQWLKVFTSSNIIFIYLQIIDFILRAFYNKIELSEITDANFLPLVKSIHFVFVASNQINPMREWRTERWE